MERYGCPIELLPVVEGALAADGFVQVLQRELGGELITLLTRDTIVITLRGDVRTGWVEIQVSGVVASDDHTLLERLPSLYAHHQLSGGHARHVHDMPRNGATATLNDAAGARSAPRSRFQAAGAWAASPRAQQEVVAEAALLFASSRELSAVLRLVAQHVAELFDGICRARLTPAHRSLPAREIIASAGYGAPIEPGAGEREVDELYASLLAARSQHAPTGTAASEGAAARLIAPLIAQERQIGELDVIMLAPLEADIVTGQRLLRLLAAHAGQAIATAAQLALLQHSGATGALGDHADQRERALALVRHDLKAPLTTLHSSLQLLDRIVNSAQPIDAARLARLVTLASASIAELNRQISALSEGAPAEPAAADSSPAPIDLVALLRLMVNFYQQATSQHELTVTASVPELIGRWERAHLDRILGNLLANAIKYSPAGGAVRVSVACEEDTLGSWATISVQDHGVGIPVAALPRLAQRSFRAGNVGALAGTGLGLASVRELVEQYGGGLAILSEAGRTTTVIIRLPLVGVG